MTDVPAWHSLRPFAPSRRGVSLYAAVRRDAEWLSFAFRLAGSLTELLLPALLPPAERSRRDGLWQTTCLELFWGTPGNAAYSELNFSPSGDWNFYRFTSYRAGMAPVEIATPPTLTVQKGHHEYLFQGRVAVYETKTLEAAMTAVLQYNDGAREYWSIAHQGEAPDFHRRDGFTLIFSEDGES